MEQLFDLVDSMKIEVVHRLDFVHLQMNCLHHSVNFEKVCSCSMKIEALQNSSSVKKKQDHFYLMMKSVLLDSALDLAYFQKKAVELALLVACF